MGSPSLSFLLTYTCQPAVMATRSVNEPGSTERNPSSLQTPTEPASRTATQNAAPPETRVQSLPSHPAPMGAQAVRQHDLSPHSAPTAQPNLPAPSSLPVEAAPANGSANVPNGNGQYEGVAKRTLGTTPHLHDGTDTHPSLPAAATQAPVGAVPAAGSTNVPNGNGQYEGVAKRTLGTTPHLHDGTDTHPSLPAAATQAPVGAAPAAGSTNVPNGSGQNEGVAQQTLGVTPHLHNGTDTRPSLPATATHVGAAPPAGSTKAQHGDGQSEGITGPSGNQVVTTNKMPMDMKVVPLPVKKLQVATRGKSSKRDHLKIDKSITLWRQLTKEQKAKLECKFSNTHTSFHVSNVLPDEGTKAFRKYRSRGTPIPYRTRLWARRESSFMLELATYSKDLAVMTFTTRVGNLMCHYHTRYTNHTSATDVKAAELGLYPKVTGVPYARTAVKSRIKKENSDDDDDDDDNTDDDDDDDNTDDDDYKPPAPAAYAESMSCGCSLEDALLDFFFWKDTTATSPSTSIREAWGVDMLDPRSRAFVCAILRGQPGIELDWLYKIERNGKIITLSQMLYKQTQATKRWYMKREAQAATGSDSEEESLLPEPNSGDKGKQKMQVVKTVSTK